MRKVWIFEPRRRLAELLAERCLALPAIVDCETVAKGAQGPCLERIRGGDIDTVVYSPSWVAKSMTPDLEEAETFFRQVSDARLRSVVVISSAAACSPSPRNNGFLEEIETTKQNPQNPIARKWQKLEQLAYQHLGARDGLRLTILRPAALPLPGERDFYSLMLQRRLALSLPGHDPSIQLLDATDLAVAVARVVDKQPPGTFHVAPDGVVPLRALFRMAGQIRVPVPRLLQSAARVVLHRLGLAFPPEQLDYIRYSWTVSNSKMKHDLGLAPEWSSAQVALRFGKSEKSPPPERTFDDFGMDESYVALFRRTVFKALRRYYWRVETRGLHHVPRTGRAVLTGMHRGFLPFDALMTLDLIVGETGRIPRFLIHPTLLKFPFGANCMTKLGGIPACRRNADYVLQRDEIVGIYPEGIRGAFRLYRDAYQLGRFRDEFVKIALENRAPLIPFVIVGSAEIYPIFAKLHSRWLKRYTLWPSFPLTPTFPLFPLPLPSKWHVRFLAPIHVEKHYPPKAAEDREIVRTISRQVRDAMQAEVDRMVRRRRSLFYGSIFPRVSAENDPSR